MEFGRKIFILSGKVCTDVSMLIKRNGFFKEKFVLKTMNKILISEGLKWIEINKYKFILI